MNTKLPKNQKNEQTLLLNQSALKNISKNLEDLSRYELFQFLSDVLREKINNKEVLDFCEQLNNIAKWMLDTRFIQLPSQGKKKKKRIRDNEGNLLQSKKQHSTDLLRYLGIDPKSKKHVPAKPLDIIKFYKGLENFVLSGKFQIDLEKLDLGHFSELCRSLVDSLSILLLSIEKLSSTEKKWTLTYLFSTIIIYRQFKVKTTPDLSTIDKEYNGDNIKDLEATFSDESISEWLHETFSEKDLNKDIIIKFYSGNASSPNSLSSTSKLLEDAWAVKCDNKLSTAILELIRFFEGGKELGHFIETLFLNLRDMSDSVHSKLFHFTAPGGKARIIANVDWITQSALSGIHYYLFSLLKKIPSDMTFDHKQGINHVFEKNQCYYSIDLSAATDRIPRFLEQKILKNIFNVRNEDGGKISELWERIMDRSFSLSEGMKRSEPISYKVGQGMGLFTSWSSMAMLHHFIVNKICNIPTSDYSLVGDDLLIKNNKEGYLKYLSVMKSIGVEVNKTKTLESEKELINIEFARNYVIMSEKIVPLQYGMLFAWADEKTSLETVLFCSDWENQKELITNFLIVFKNFFSEKKIIYLLFADIKNSSNMIDLKVLKDIFNLPEWVLKIDYQQIKKITHKENSETTSLILEDRSPISTLKSKLTVRTQEDVKNVVDLSERFILLKFVDDDIAKIAIAWHDRMNNVSIIQYDVEFLGNPYFSKRELRLIDEIIAFNNNTSKQPK